jgi:hypothetical protein
MPAKRPSPDMTTKAVTPATKKPADARAHQGEHRDLRRLIGDIAVHVIGNNRRRRDEVVPKILEAFVLQVLAEDERFVSSVKGFYWQRAEVFERNELERRAKEERDAEAATGSLGYVGPKGRDEDLWGAPVAGQGVPGGAA